MKNIFLILFLFYFNISYSQDSLVRYEEPKEIIDASKYLTKYIPTYTYEGPEASLEGLQCPIPHKDRVKNYTGIQCVYSSIEALGRWAEEPKLTTPPITSRPDCKGYSSPDRAATILKKLNVKFEQTYGNKEKVCWVDNSDSSLKVQQTTVEKFKKRWGSWVLVIYADQDIVTSKVYKYNLPIIDFSNPYKKFEKGFVPFPISF